MKENKSELEIQLTNNTKTGKNYTDVVKKFALTLQFYSSRAYEFVRSSFNNNLPHIGTIRRWLSTVDGNPGISKEALATLKYKIEVAKKENRTLVGCIIFDEMSIRKQITFFKGKLYGHVDYGLDFEEPSKQPIASEALVFLVNIVNDRWKVPIAYYLTNGLNGFEKMGILREVLSRVQETGLLINAIVFDGHRANMSLALLLGVCFDIDNINPAFQGKYS